jgi:hypothetical protein
MSTVTLSALAKDKPSICTALVHGQRKAWMEATQIGRNGQTAPRVAEKVIKKGRDPAPILNLWVVDSPVNILVRQQKVDHAR